MGDRASSWEGSVCAGLFHAPPGCRVAGTDILRDPAAETDRGDAGRCMGSVAEATFFRNALSRLEVLLLGMLYRKPD